MIKHISGGVLIQDYVAPASTVFVFNDVVTVNSSGRLARATATTPRAQIVGLIQADIATTDSNYASIKTVPVLLTTCDDAEFEADVDTGTATSASVNLSIDLADENGLNANASTQRAFRITNFISSTKVRGRFLSDGLVTRLVSYSETVLKSAFTDGGAASGTFDLKTSIPAGAVFARAFVTGIVGFTGDTSAILTIGDGTDVDRYNTGTPSVFATAPAGVDIGAPSGTLFHATATVPKLTVTSAADFTIVAGAGSVTVSLFWYQAV